MVGVPFMLDLKGLSKSCLHGWVKIGHVPHVMHFDALNFKVS